jgi:hypothetical protein
MNCIYTLQRNDHGQWKYITTLEDAFVEQLQLFYYQCVDHTVLLSGFLAHPFL